VEAIVAGPGNHQIWHRQPEIALERAAGFVLCHALAQSPPGLPVPLQFSGSHMSPPNLVEMKPPTGVATRAPRQKTFNAVRQPSVKSQPPPANVVRLSADAPVFGESGGAITVRCPKEIFQLLQNQD